MVINVFDIGGRFGPHRSWELFTLPVKYYSFDADKEEVESLKAMVIPNGNLRMEFRNVVFSDSEKEAVLHLYEPRGMSSLFEINPSATIRWSDVAHEGDISVQTTTVELFSSLNNAKPHFLCIDAQGSSYDILTGTGAFLHEILGIRIEVEFVQLYKECKCFDSSMRLLYSNKFQLIRLENCGAAKTGISGDMNQFSVNPDDAMPSHADAIFLNRGKIDSLIIDASEDSVGMLAYVIVFTILNGVGFYGMNILHLLISSREKLKLLKLLEPEHLDALLALTIAYLELPRSGINRGKSYQELINSLSPMITTGTQLSDKHVESLSRLYFPEK